MKIQEFQNLYERMDENKVEENFRKDFPTNYGEWECFKSDIPFEKADLDEIMYVPEMAYKDLPEVTGYVFSKQDLIDECNGNENLAEYVYSSLEWQCPSTYIEELLNNYADIVIDYDKDSIYDGDVHETLWKMLTKEEQEMVLSECHTTV